MNLSLALRENRLNRSAHTDTQQPVAAARRLLRAGSLQRWAS